MLIVLIGESGAGKTTIENSLTREKFSQSLTSCTSRSKRSSDLDNAYYFISREEFEEESNDFIEKELFGNNYYGVTKTELDRVLTQNKRASFVCTLGGYEQIIKKIGNTPSVLFYITCDEEILKDRMRSRGDSEESINYRMEQDRSRFKDKITHDSFERPLPTISKVKIDHNYEGYMIDTSSLSEGEVLESVKNIVLLLEEY